MPLRILIFTIHSKECDMHIKRLLLRQCISVFILGIALSLKGQDTLRLQISEAENIFLKQNLQLMIQQYSIDSARALIIQAKLYNNPSFLAAGNLYNPKEKKVLDVSNRTGEYSLGVQQLMILAGKRNKQIHLAETNAKLADQSFY